MNKKKILSLLLVFIIFFQPALASEEIIYNENSANIQAVETVEQDRFPNYSKIYAGEDKYEKFNRRMFNLNSRLNKYIAKPVHIIWASIMPKYGMDRIRSAYNNIEYPKRLASCILQKDGKGIKDETLRFLTNTTIGLGGLFDPADKIFKVKPTNENMEQALCKCKMNSGSYLVMPVLNSCTPRSLCGRSLEAALDPCVYLASPLISVIKFGLMLNRTSYMQPIAQMIETNYADPYDIHKKLFGIENYIRNANLDREDLLKKEHQLVEEGYSDLAEELIENLGNENVNTGMAAKITEDDIQEILQIENKDLKADIVLADFKPQNPVTDSMRTALFEDKSVNKSIWNELSVWNRSFGKKIKTSSIIVTENREPYKFKYILQKDKTAPLVILYPSIGESAGNHHSIIFAKMFYDEGFSVLMLGSHFNWEFAKSMPADYAPGLPEQDTENLQFITSKAIKYLNNRYEYNPAEKYVIGTSFGAMTTIFLGDLENKNNVLNITKFIAISPPIDLKYALEQADKNSEEFDKSSEDVKHKTAVTAAKILQLLDLKNEKTFSIETLPFTEEEGKLITTFFIRQKLSDLIYTLEGFNNKVGTKENVYKMINNMNFKDYVEKYLSKGVFYGQNYADISKDANLYKLSAYLKNNNNYKIYESFDDFFINKDQIRKLKELSGSKLVCLNCGAHLGYLYRNEFKEALKKEIVTK